MRILGSVLALLISVLANNPRWLFIALILRVFIKLGDAVVGLVLDGVTANTKASISLKIPVWRMPPIICLDKVVFPRLVEISHKTRCPCVSNNIREYGLELLSSDPLQSTGA